VINNTVITATVSTLLVQTAANNNDWDGTTGAGQLDAVNGGILEIRDNAQFGFTGRVSATTNGTVFANGFELRFNSGSTLNLDSGTYRATQTTFIGGTVTVGAGGGRLQNDPGLGFVFVNGSDADLTGDLRLDSSTTVNVGAEYKGAGSLVNRALLRLVDDAIVGVRIENQADLEIGGMNTGNIGQVTVGALEQTSAGELIIHLGGIASGAFDLLKVDDIAQLDGALRLAPTGGYVPMLGQGFQFLQANSVTGTFASVIQPTGMPAGLMFAVQYGAKDVSLKVVVDAGLTGDYNHDGAVNAANYVVWRKNDGSQQGYNTWRTNFGRTAGAASSLTSSVPEPTGAILCCVHALLVFARRRRVLKSQRNNAPHWCQPPLIVALANESRHLG
jgi:hypothetical protein